MRELKASLAYFAGVFSIAFILGAIRVALVVEHLGERWAELLELPLILLASYGVARMCMRRFGPFTAGSRLRIGIFALVFMISAELGLNFSMGQDLGEYISSRDPVSGSAYLLALALFSLMPLIVGSGPDRNPAFKH